MKRPEKKETKGHVVSGGKPPEAPTKVCPHWKRATDGVHAVLIDQCKNPDCEKWFQG